MDKAGLSPLSFEPCTPAFAADPYPFYAALRERSPVFHSAEFGMTFLTRYHDIFAALTDKRLGRAPLQAPARLAALPHYDRYVRVNLLETEGATHGRLRRLLAQALSPKRVLDLHGRVQEVANGLVAKLEPGVEIDFIPEVAEPLPVIVISELLGWPESERHRLRPWSADIVRLYEQDATEEDAERAEQSSREFADMLDALAEERKAAPAEDFISALVALEDEANGLSRVELISSCMLLLNAGHEATVNAAGNGLLALLRHPEAMHRLRREPGLLGSTVEEMLRYDAPLHLFHRYAYEDLEIGGHAIPRGGRVGLLYGAANRDPGMFPEPDRFDIARSPNRHLAFGAATHFCLGAPLARLELRTLFGTLLAGTDCLELRQEPEHRPGLVFRALKHLQVRNRAL